jgi:uncharacterized protein YjiS (DUF1127 family)
MKPDKLSFVQPHPVAQLGGSFTIVGRSVMAALARQPLTNCQASALPSSSRFAGWIRQTIRLWQARSRERHAFDFVSERELRDLGLSRWDFEREISKPFWRA